MVMRDSASDTKPATNPSEGLIAASESMLGLSKNYRLNTEESMAPLKSIKA
jgi:hypothetical protein